MGEELKRLEIKDGKFCLDGKVVDAEILGLGIITRSWDSSEPIHEVVKRHVAGNVNAYYLGKSQSVKPEGWGSEEQTPTLYLHIKQ